MAVIYGIKNCDKCRATLKWFEKQGIEHRFHDVRADGLTKKQVKQWLASEGGGLVNKRSTTWRSLDADQRDRIESGSGLELLLDQPTLIKRPLIEDGNDLMVGYDDARWRTHFGV